jgi:hypothetical protein
MVSILSTAVTDVMLTSDDRSHVAGADFIHEGSCRHRLCSYIAAALQ